MIVLIPKPRTKDKTDPGNLNCRGVSLLPCMGKLLTAVLNARLQEFTEC